MRTPASHTHDSTNAADFAADDDNVFARLASRYDVMCDLFSLYAHRIWKARMARRIADECGGVILDVASGTGDIPVRLLRRLDRRPHERTLDQLVVTDLCPQMLAIAESKTGHDRRVRLAIADAHHLSEFADASVDAYSISFGMKILDRVQVLAEAHRVLRPGGRLYCLEAAQIPVRFVHAAYLRYMNFCLPLIARMATSGDKGAYDYFLKGIHGFPSQPEFAAEIAQAGFNNVEHQNLTFGIVAIHSATKPG